jgi:hypothetical protein
MVAALWADVILTAIELRNECEIGIQLLILM